jgi:hypothetical protein
MNDPLTIMGIVGMFLLRIGVPVVLLVVLGKLIDHWQTRRREQIDQEIYQNS